MSYISSTNNSSILNSAIASLGSVNNGTSYTTQPSNYFKTFPTFKIEMFKSENGGFVMNLITYKDIIMEQSKLFILNDLENLGRDIQNILVMEILKN